MKIFPVNPKRNFSCGGKRELELLEFAVQSEIKAGSDWSDYEKRRVRKLYDWIVRSRA